MTDWTKKNSEDDEFISWMNKDKKKYESLYPKKIKIMVNPRRLFYWNFHICSNYCVNRNIFK